MAISGGTRTKGKDLVDEKPPKQEGPKTKTKKSRSNKSLIYKLQLHSKHQRAPSPPPEVSVGGEGLLLLKTFLPADQDGPGPCRVHSQRFRESRVIPWVRSGGCSLLSHVVQPQQVGEGVKGLEEVGGGSPPQITSLCKSVTGLHPLCPIHAENQYFRVYQAELDRNCQRGGCWADDLCKSMISF